MKFLRAAATLVFALLLCSSLPTTALGDTDASTPPATSTPAAEDSSTSTDSPPLADQKSRLEVQQEQFKAMAPFLFVGSIVGVVVGLLFAALMFWKVFTKAGYPGWASLIPIYNMYVLCKIGGKPGWWVLLMFIPLVGIILLLLVCIDIAKNFGQGAGYGVGLFFLGFIFFPILGFGDAQYIGPRGDGLTPLPAV